jgi:hypothetical protein
MILDKELCFADEQAITTDANSEHVLDLSVARNIGKGEPMAAVVFITTDFDTTEEDGTLDISVITDDNVNMSSETIIASAPQLAEAALVAGREPIVIPIPSFYTAERYLALDFNVGSHTFTAGKVDAYLVPLSFLQTNK